MANILPSKSLVELDTTIEDTRVKCNKCGNLAEMSEMYTVHNLGAIEYECVDEKGCYNRKNADRFARQKKQRELQKKCAHLSKEEQLREMFDVNFEDLIENPVRYRDASIHYKHKTTGVRYTWCWGSKCWSSR
jgi:hypothetical protein